jgi:hypothetical protein
LRRRWLQLALHFLTRLVAHCADRFTDALLHRQLELARDLLDLALLARPVERMAVSIREPEARPNSNAGFTDL